MKPLVIGLGNSMRGDDGVGPEVVKTLSHDHPDLADYMIIDNEVLIPSGDYKNRENIILIDALEDDSLESGSILRIHPSDVDALKKSRVSSHGMGVDQWISMINILNEPAPVIIIYGIVGKMFGLGSEISREVQKSIDQVIVQILEIIVPNSKKT